MSSIDALRSVTNVYLQAQKLYCDSILEEEKAAHTKRQEVVMQAMSVLISGKQFDQQRLKQASESYPELRDFLVSLSSHRFERCPNELSTVLCAAYVEFIGQRLAEHSLASLHEIFANMYRSFLAVHNTYKDKIGGILEFNEAPHYFKANEYIEYLRRTVFLVLGHLCGQLHLLDPLETSAVENYLKMRFGIALTSEEKILQSAVGNRNTLRIAKEVYLNALRGTIANEEKLLYYTVMDGVDPKIHVKLLQELDVDSLVEVTLHECAWQVQPHETADRNSQRRRIQVTSQMREEALS